MIFNETLHKQELDRFAQDMNPFILGATDAARSQISNAVFDAISSGSIHKEKTRHQLIAFAKENVLGPNTHPVTQN